MIGKKISKSSSVGFALIALAVMLGLYSFLSYSQHQKNPESRTIPTWQQLWSGCIYLIEKKAEYQSNEQELLALAMQDMGMEAEPKEKSEGFLEGRVLWEASRATLGRLFTGLAVGMAGGIVAGVFMGCFLKLNASISPLMYFFSRIIPTAAMPIFFKMAGIDFEMYLAIIVFGSMPIVTLTISKYVQDYPDELKFKAYTLGASNWELISQVIFPYILPKVIDLCILMIGPALVYLIAAEQIVAGEGFGYRIRVLTKATRFEVVYPLIVILTLYAAVLTFGLNKLRDWSCPWYQKT